MQLATRTALRYRTVVSSYRFLLPSLFLLSNKQSRSLWAMSPFHTERSDGTIVISPKNEAQQSALVVISHGLGDTSEGFADVAEVGSL